MLIAVIPAFNEEISIGTVVLHTRQFVDHVIVVDDGSKDRTADGAVSQTPNYQNGAIYIDIKIIK